jgi:hypothetical protein
MRESTVDNNPQDVPLDPDPVAGLLHAATLFRMGNASLAMKQIALVNESKEFPNDVREWLSMRAQLLAQSLAILDAALAWASKSPKEALARWDEANEKYKETAGSLVVTFTGPLHGKLDVWEKVREGFAEVLRAKKLKVLEGR